MAAGNVVSRHYDSLLVKVICKGPTFLAAVQKAQRALYEFHIRGVKTNILYLENVLRHPEFLSGEATTSFIERHPALFNFSADSMQSSKILTYLADVIVNGPRHAGATGPPPAETAPPPPVAPAGAPPAGWRDVLLKNGPEGWAAAVRAHSGLLVTDTTWRDAHQSLLATRVRTHDLLLAAPATAHILAPAASLEMWGGATFDVALRFLHECPWRRLEALRERVPNIPFQMLLRGANAVGYTSYADNVVKQFVREAHTGGVDIFRVFDSLNYLDNLLFGVDAVRSVPGAVAQGTLCYTGDLTNPKRSDKYTLDYYLKLADDLVGAGAHCLAVKDMAGLLKPAAATQLVSALRTAHPTIPIHVHTHDTAGTGVATVLAAAAAGADVVDGAVDSMAGTTSQPSLGAIVACTAGTPLDTGIDAASLARLASFWEGTRALYAPFESDMRAPSADVYDHEMPGGQYTNLKFQATTLGLGDSWDAVKAAYAAANRALGDIVKVTPSSKVVGDLAQFMVSNSLDEHTVVERAAELSFPASVVEYMQGALGQPAGGFPEPLRSRVLKGAPTIEGRPGASLPPSDLAGLAATLRSKHGPSITPRDALSAALYPAVFEEFKEWEGKYSRYTAALPTRAFLAPLREDEEVEVELAPGNVVSIKFKAVSPLRADGSRDVFFEANGVPRVVDVADVRAADGSAGGAPLRRAARERADPMLLGSVGAPMAGEVVDIKCAPGTRVVAGEPLIVLSAMKMETAVVAPTAGVIAHVAVEKGDTIDAGDLLALIKDDLPDISDDALASVDDAALAAAGAA